MKPFVIAFMAAFLVSASALVVIGQRIAAKRAALDTERGWRPLPMLVVTRDLKEGVTISDDALREAELPEQFLTESRVLPSDRAAIVGRTLDTPLSAGDVLTWAVFAPEEGRRLRSTCVEQLISAVADAGAQAEGTAVDAFVARVGEALPEAPPIPGLEEGETIEVLVTLEDLDEGEALEDGRLGVRRFPRAFVTASHVRAAQRPLVSTNARVLEPMMAGDAVLWQLLDRRDAPRSTIACAHEGNRARIAARAAAAREGAEAFARAKAER